MTNLNARLSKLQNAMDEIEAAGDAARLQLHLLSMQARERTGEFGASIESLEQKIDRGIEQAMQTATSKTRELTTTVREFLGKLPTQLALGLQARSIMTASTRTCSPADSLNTAAQLMWDADCGAVMVVASDGKLCGIITDRDICMATYTQGRPLTALRAGDIMSRPVHTCRPDETIDRVATIMAEGQIRRLPVVDGDGRPIGIISVSDIALAAAAISQRQGQVLVFRLLQAVSKPRREATAVAHAAQ